MPKRDCSLAARDAVCTPISMLTFTRSLLEHAVSGASLACRPLSFTLCCRFAHTGVTVLVVLARRRRATTFVTCGVSFTQTAHPVGFHNAVKCCSRSAFFCLCLFCEDAAHNTPALLASSASSAASSAPPRSGGVVTASERCCAGF